MWLRIAEGEVVEAVLDISSITSVAKHWTGTRSEFCLGEGCPHCCEGRPKRWRYQAKVYLGENAGCWEFGEQALEEIGKLSHSGHLVPVAIARSGTGKDTRYLVRARPAEMGQREGICPEAVGREAENHRRGGKCQQDKAARPAPAGNKYLRGRYGHLVKT